MSRWEPDAAGRLQRAALDLYAGRGFETTTVAEIAERAGLTERTFFRHFADKREVLFQGSEELEAQIVQATIAAPPQLGAFAATTVALESLSPFFEDRRDWSSHRRAVIASSSDLRERELIKLASLVTAITAALRERGVGAETAQLCAETGVTCFHVAYERWIEDPGGRSYAEHVRQTVDQLRATCVAEVSAAQPAPVATGR